MKIRSFLILLLLGAGQAFAQKTVMVTAHRGDWRNAPENSLRAFENAAAMGVDMVELDLGKTRDSVLIIMHDQTIDRTTNGKGRPADYTLAELRKFGLKNGLGRVTRNHIPTFKEVMLALKGKPVMVNLDKSYPYYREAYAVLKETGTLKQAVFKAEVTYPMLHQRYGSLIDSITYMPVVNLDKADARANIKDYLQHMKPWAFELNFKSDTSSVLKDNKFITRTGARVWLNALWTSLNAGHEDDLAVEDGNTKDSWDWLINHGAAVIQTDRPKELLQYLRSKHLHK
ncbi:glycerophosphodiester phosphodiesterase family protein [Mucilaginibacter sp. 44-25]|uniref:glycerophosphodiester phosphodiesterase family protein n=1 Tax=Mucilaginibacter sp. 44-25 TaxID=1895794 RepID=UPI00095FBF11|nr:glycerophosphodiester phosphodiesterase family protein [Mucilaginibacter sp. 44-25]OJW12522.1 MAG: glycerophosphodiester phosphodiesterase [Mucilaginibacter sp. 44-25]HEK19195.1 glycerophosphodiester phosphodiesterase family protein [Bacteroidota bacterium]